MAEYDSYIDSQIPYVGAIPSHWKTAPNKRVMHKEKRICDSYAGQDIISLTMKGAIVRDLGAGGKMPTTFDGYQFVYPGELLMCLFDIDVTPRCVGRVYNEGLTSPAYSSFVLHDNADLGYFFYYYLMLDHTKELLHLAKNLRHSLTEEQLGQIKVPLPPIEEQAAIATYLDRETARIDAVIAEAKASIEEYKAWKASIIYEAVTKGLDPNVEMKDSGITWIGRMPASWKTMRIKDLGDARNGLTYSPEEQVDEGKGILVLRSSNVQGGKLVFTDNVYIGSEIPSELMLQQGDILICSRNGSRKLIGKNAYIEEDNKYSFGAFMMALRPKIRNKKYVYWLLNSGVFGYYLPMFFTSTINQLTRENFRNMVVPYCDDEFVQKRIVEYLDTKVAQIDSVIEDKERLIDDMEHYKKSLIFEVVTGKRKVV